MNEENEIFEDNIAEWQKEDEFSETILTSDIKEKQLRVIRNNKDYDLEYLVNSIDKNIFLGPAYQRRSRWTKKQKSLLIESLLLNIPIPPIYLYEREYHIYEVVDGRQRLEAIKDFFQDKFKLKNLEYINFNGKFFKDFTTDEKRLLQRRSISATVLLTESKGFDEVDLRMILFNRLNTGGVKLNAQELRNAIFSGKFNDLLIDLSQNSIFRQLWNIPNPIKGQTDYNKLIKMLPNNPLFKTMSDCELVLRVFGINEVFENGLTGSMKNILDSTMKMYQNIDESLLEKFKFKFEKAMEFIVSIFEGQGIKNPTLSPPKRARNLYDSFVVAYWNSNEDNLNSKEVIIEKLQVLLADNENYDKIITKGNSIENIKFRVTSMIKIFSN